METRIVSERRANPGKGSYNDITDVKNVDNRYGGTITAALFLAEFVDNTPWVHLDIAGPCLPTKERGYVVRGAPGFGVRTLVELALSEAKSREAI